MIEEIRFQTENGEGVAMRTGYSGEPWHVMAPEGALQFYGTVREVKARIVEFVGTDVRFTGPNQEEKR